MDRKQVDAEIGCTADSALDGFWNVVKLEIEKDALVAGEQFLDDGSAFGGIKLQADLVEADARLKLVDKVESPCAGFDIEGDDDGVEV